METAETIKEKKLVYQIPEKMHQKEADEKVEKVKLFKKISLSVLNYGHYFM